jgi:hypothetical protein
VSRTKVIRNGHGYPASLELRKIYQVVADARAAEHQFIRVIDESGEDCLYPEDYFIPIELPQAVEQALSLTAERSLQQTPA